MLPGKETCREHLVIAKYEVLRTYCFYPYFVLRTKYICFSFIAFLGYRHLHTSSSGNG